MADACAPEHEWGWFRIIGKKGHFLGLVNPMIELAFLKVSINDRELVARRPLNPSQRVNSSDGCEV